MKSLIIILFIFSQQLLSQVVINEIMFDVDSTGSEYIELYNNSHDTIFLSGYVIDDKASYGKGKGNILDSSAFILPYDYILFFSDSVIFDKFNELNEKEGLIYIKNMIKLNNSGDFISLSSISGQIMDSLNYEDKWHDPELSETKNRSLERKSYDSSSWRADNWSSCSYLLGGSPLAVNSCINIPILNKNIITIESNPFSTSSGTVINLNLPYESSNISLLIFNFSGIEKASIVKNVYAGNTVSFRWNGDDGRGGYLTAGPYILYLEAADLQSKKNYDRKKINCDRRIKRM